MRQVIHSTKQCKDIQSQSMELPCRITYRKISYISLTKSQNLNDSHLVLQSSLPNPLKPGVKLRMKM